VLPAYSRSVAPGAGRVCGVVCLGAVVLPRAAWVFPDRAPAAARAVPVSPWWPVLWSFSRSSFSSC